MKTIEVTRPDGTTAIVRGVAEIENFEDTTEALFLYGPDHKLLYGFGEWTSWRVWQGGQGDAGA